MAAALCRPATVAAHEHYAEQARALDDMGTVKIVGIDDTSLHKGQRYLTVVHDLATKRLLFAT